MNQKLHSHNRLRQNSRPRIEALLLGLALCSNACAPADESWSDVVEGDEGEIAAVEQPIASGPTNLALYRPTLQSSTANGGHSARAVDGVTNGAWYAMSVTHTNDEPKPWWQVDLGSVQAVSSIVLHNRTDCCSDRLANFSVLVSDDGTTNWRLAALHPGTTPSQITLNLVDWDTGQPLRTQFIRVQLNGTNALSLAEVEVYSPKFVDIAYRKNVWQSTTSGSNGDAWHAVDGNTDGVFTRLSTSQTEFQYRPYLTVDLGSPQPIAAVVLWNRTDGAGSYLSNFALKLSNDNINWTSYNHPGGVLSSTSFYVNASARFVAVQLNDWGILSLAELQVLAAPESQRARVVDLGGTSPGSTKYLEQWWQSRTLDPLLDFNDRHLTGDFMGLGYDQVLHLDRSGVSGTPRVKILDYSGTAVGGSSRYVETWGQSNLLNGWDNDGDLFLSGDFLGLGRDQAMYINRDPSGGKIMITDYAGGAVPGAVRYLENWGYSGLLNGWLDANDLQLVGDFMGLGRSQVMYINRSGVDGKVMIVDYQVAAPGAARYWEVWGQNPLLSGWLDADDLQYVGDFMGLGHSQVMYINRGGGGGKVMIVDYASGVVPGVIKYWENWGQTGQMSGWIDNGDMQLVGDFTGVGHDQLLLFNAQNEANGKLQVLDYGAGTWPATQRYVSNWQETGELQDWPAPRDLLLAGEFRNTGRAELLGHRIGQTSSYQAIGGNPGSCPAGQTSAPVGCVPGCPAGQTLIDDQWCVTLVPHNDVTLPDGARVAFRINSRIRYNAPLSSPFSAPSSNSEAYGPGWLGSAYHSAWQSNQFAASAGALTRANIFIANRTYDPYACSDSTFSLRASNGAYVGDNRNSFDAIYMSDYGSRGHFDFAAGSGGRALRRPLCFNGGTYNYNVAFRDFGSSTLGGLNTGWNRNDYTPMDTFLVE